MDYLKTNNCDGTDISTRWQYSGQIQSIDEFNSIDISSIDPRTLKFNPTELEKFNQLIKEIELIGNVTEPSKEEFDSRIKQINNEIDSFLFQIKEQLNTIEAKSEERDELLNQTANDFSAYEKVQGQLFELLSSRNLIKQEIEIKEKLLAAKKSKKSSQKQKNSTEDVETSLRSLYESLIQINDEISELNEKRDAAKKQQPSVISENKKFEGQVQQIKNKIGQLKNKIQMKKNEKDQITVDYNSEFEDYKYKLNQRLDLECQLKKIIVEANKRACNLSADE